jgi:hypothetical protein
MPGVYVNIHEAPLNYSDRIIIEERAKTAQNANTTGRMIHYVS